MGLDSPCIVLTCFGSAWFASSRYLFEHVLLVTKVRSPDAETVKAIYPLATCQLASTASEPHIIAVLPRDQAVPDALRLNRATDTLHLFRNPRVEAVVWAKAAVVVKHPTGAIDYSPFHSHRPGGGVRRRIVDRLTPPVRPEGGIPVVAAMEETEAGFTLQDTTATAPIAIPASVGHVHSLLQSSVRVPTAQGSGWTPRRHRHHRRTSSLPT